MEAGNIHLYAAKARGYFNSVTPSKSVAVYVKPTPLTAEEARAVISYDPETGKFVWLTDASRRVKAGTEAGCRKKTHIKSSGKYREYVYIRFKDYQYTAAQMAWLLHYGEWPQGSILFKDGNTLNLRIDNLKMADFPSIKTEKAGRKIYKMSPEAGRHYGLKRNYGLSLDQYREMLQAQDGKCAICGNGETAIVHGKVKTLAVDHDHATGAVRGLLCYGCNSVLGQARDDRELLLNAIKYLDRHAGNNVLQLKKDNLQ